MKSILVVIAVALLVATPAVAAQHTKTASHNATKKELAVLKTAFADKLKDPYSMKLKDVRVASDGTVCGQVNAKNSYGGYTGYREFMGMMFGTVSAVVIAIDDGNSTFAETECAKKGLE